VEALVGVLVIWALLALALAVVVGRGIRIADERSSTLTTADLPAGFTPEVGTARR
jgi:hypothetical protein